jgi:chromosomal replication initiator protein
MKAEQAWQATVGQLQLEMPKPAFDTWVCSTDFISYEDGAFIIGVPNAYARDWLESRLTSTAKRLLSGIMNRTVSIRFIVWKNQESGETLEEENEPETIPFSSNHLISTKINLRYTFENFVVGTNSRLAHAASLAVAERPAQAYNPLFLYGGVGLGKTHLLHAIGNLSIQRGLQIIYVSSEEFTNDLINAIRSQTTQTFRDKYRSIDVLLIDDIQFIAGKESTQEEFFHTFNTLHSQDKQIVISSDRPPKALNTLEERLRSRFEWGLCADIQLPDFETRLAILQSKAERASRRISPDIMELIARRVQSNIRELEGALTRVTAFADLSGLPLNAGLVNSVLEDMLPRRTEVQPEEVIRRVAEAFEVTLDHLLSRDRSRQVALPRQIAMYLLREESNVSLPQIGEALGGRDHTTVMYACNKIADLMERDDRLRRQVVEIRENLYERPKYLERKL